MFSLDFFLFVCFDIVSAMNLSNLLEYFLLRDVLYSSKLNTRASFTLEYTRHTDAINVPYAVFVIVIFYTILPFSNDSLLLLVTVGSFVHKIARSAFGIQLLRTKISSNRKAAL